MSNLNVVKQQFGPHAPQGTADKLREIADSIDRGEVTGVLVAYMQDNEYRFGMWGASIKDDLVLATLLREKTLDQFYA